MCTFLFFSIFLSTWWRNIKTKLMIMNLILIGTLFWWRICAIHFHEGLKMRWLSISLSTSKLWVIPLFFFHFHILNRRFYFFCSLPKYVRNETSREKNNNRKVTQRNAKQSKSKSKTTKNRQEWLSCFSNGRFISGDSMVPVKLCEILIYVIFLFFFSLNLSVRLCH